jgi:hypothetical protein
MEHRPYRSGFSSWVGEQGMSLIRLDSSIDDNEERPPGLRAIAHVGWGVGDGESQECKDTN